MTVKDLMIENFDPDIPDDQLFEEATATWIDNQGSAFDRWKDEAKEAGTYHNPLIGRL